MNAALTLIPLIFIRFVLLGLLNKDALKRAAFFAPLVGKEQVAYYVYQISNILIFLYLFFLTIKPDSPLISLGLIVYILGILICLISTINFALTKRYELTKKGIYKFSRNPMYIGYFVYFLGCVILTNSVLLFILLLVFQISTHWIILSKERWCEEEFNEEYLIYKKKVRRYL